MKILVYGAGVIGCELAHMLVRAGKHVTVLARGEWKGTLEHSGIVIRHYAQFTTTVDRVHVVDTLPSQDIYDLIFVVMQYNQFPEALPVVARNRSRYVVLVGNNPDAETALQTLISIDPHKEVAFGFQSTGGRREDGRVVSVHAGVGMTVGAYCGHLSTEFQKRIKKAFHGAKYRLSWELNMNAWLKCHLALILPVAYVCYSVDCELPRASRIQRKAILDAALEGCETLKSLGILIRDEDSTDYFRPGVKRRRMEVLLFFMAKTPLGRLAASDHCRHAFCEIEALDESFETLRRKAGHPMPTWERLRMPDGNHVIHTYVSRMTIKKGP